MTESTAKMQGRRSPGRPFEKGKSGNPAGRPPGSRHRYTMAAESLLEGEAEALTRKAVEAALAGDMQAIRLCLDRVLPPRKDRAICFPLPAMTNAADALSAIGSIVTAVAAGELTPAEGTELSRLVEAFAKTSDLVDHEARIKRLEELQNGKN